MNGLVSSALSESRRPDNAVESPRALTIKEFCHLYRLSPTTVYEEFNEQRLTAKKVRGKTLIDDSEAKRWWADQPERGRKTVAA